MECGDNMTRTSQEYNYIVISEKDFDMSQWALFPDIVTYFAKYKEDMPSELVPYSDIIQGLCIWSSDSYDNPGVPYVYTHKTAGLSFNVIGKEWTRELQNMSALDVAVFSFVPETTGKDSLKMPPRYLAPGEVWDNVDVNKFVVTLKGEVEGSDDALEPWAVELLYDEDRGIGNVHRSLIMKVDPTSPFVLLVLDNPHFNVSPLLSKLKARFSQIISATAGMRCYVILRYFIETQFMMHVQLKPPSKLQEDVCAWLLEALPKCRVAASQHGELVHLLHLAEKLRNLRVDILMKDRAEKEDEMLMDVERRLEETVNSGMWGGPIDEAGKNFLLMLKNIGAIRDHRTVVDKSALHTLNNHEALCCQACKESYDPPNRTGLRTGTSLHYYIPDISSEEMAYFYNPHNQNLLVACRGTSVGKDLEKADIDVEPLKDPNTSTRTL